MGTIKEVIIFFKDSAKRMFALRSEITHHQEEYIFSTNKKHLLSLCDTHWVDRNTSIETFLELYIPIVNTLDTFCISCFLLSDIVSFKSFATNRNIGFCIG